jgi:hypothetical protein
MASPTPPVKRTGKEDPDNTERIYPFISFLKKEWGVMKSTSFWIIAVVVTLAIWAIQDHHYGGIVKTQEATIRTVEAERDRYRSQLQDAGIISTPLKKRAVVLATQLREFAISWAAASEKPRQMELYNEFSNRFEGRIYKVLSELDEQGQSQKAINVNDIQNRLLNSQNTAKEAAEINGMANAIERLANQLKD